MITSFTAAGSAVNPERNGTKAAAHYTITVPAGDKTEIRLRLTDLAPQALTEAAFGSHFDAVLQARKVRRMSFISPSRRPQRAQTPQA